MPLPPYIRYAAALELLSSRGAPLVQMLTLAGCLGLSQVFGSATTLLNHSLTSNARPWRALRLRQGSSKTATVRASPNTPFCKTSARPPPHSTTRQPRHAPPHPGARLKTPAPKHAPQMWNRSDRDTRPPLGHFELPRRCSFPPPTSHFHRPRRLQPSYEFDEPKISFQVIKWRTQTRRPYSMLAVVHLIALTPLPDSGSAPD